MPLIYMVEDEANIRELVVYTLKASGLEAEGFEGAADFDAAMAAKRPDALLLDIMLPGESGLDIMRRLRAGGATRSLPILMLTARDTEYDKVIGLDAGADDYLTKPFGMMELVSRIRALLRRSGYGAGEAEHPAVSAGPVTLLRDRHVVTVEGQAVSLTLKEYALLELLMEHPGIVFSRDALLERIWGYSYEGETRTVDVHVRSLRQKLGTAAGLVETVRGVGYRFAEADR